ncbi:fibroblast growth factor-binding protein 1 [Mixophyes fleayi]|uniref:fibroblast growth factor-binding protein 1 n=1 Tax=Mixophyes fleayi TaxID=3061075 RepID=UPI003F4DF9E9
MRLKKIFLLSVVIILVSQTLLVEGNKQREGKKNREGTAEEKPRGAAKEEGKQSPTRNGKGKGSKGSLQGKFVAKDKADCVWSVSGTETMVLNIDCTNGETRVSCTFGGTPTACPGYAGNQKNYWKQITRALKKQKNICQDQKAVLKSKVCKSGPKEAHLSYIIHRVKAPEHGHNNHGQVRPTTKIDTNERSKECMEDPEIIEAQRAAKEYCGDSWGSLCSFFFSMVQSKNC